MALTTKLERQTSHYESACRHIAAHRNTIYRDVPFDKLVPLGFCVKYSYLKVADLHQLIDRVCEIYDPSYLYNDWQKYCRALLSEEQRAFITLEGALYFAKINLPSSTERDRWMFSCLNSFQSLKYNAEREQRLNHSHQGNEERPSSTTTGHLADTSSALVRSLPRAQISPILVQEATISHCLNNDSIALPPAKNITDNFVETSVERQELNVAMPQQMTTSEHQHDTLVPNKRNLTIEDKQEQMKFIKLISKEINYKGSAMPANNLPRVIDRLPAAIKGSKQWKWERKFFKDDVARVEEDVDRTNCLHVFVPEDPTHDVSITLLVGFKAGLELIYEAGFIRA